MKGTRVMRFAVNTTHARPGRGNPMYVMAAVGLIAIAILSLGLWALSHRWGGGGDAKEIFVYCASNMRKPMEKIAADYEREYGVVVRLDFDGSNTLLSRVEVSRKGDLYLAGDDSYIHLARDKELLRESIPLAKMRPVIAVHKDNDSIRSVADLLKPGVKVVMAEPDAAAVGKKARKLFKRSGHWDALEEQIRERGGVFVGNAPDVANKIKLGSMDAGIVWDSTVAMYPELKAVRVPELDAGEASVEIGVLNSSFDATSALKFARYVGARDKGLLKFKETGFEIVEGDKWAERPTLSFFIGSVNRRAIEPIIEAFQVREGVTINTKYNGCGILTGDMKAIQSGELQTAFPDTYLACDEYYLDTVQSWFETGVQVSDTDIVIAVPKDNPAGITKLADLAKPGVRVALGNAEQCTIGALSRRLLEAEDLYDKISDNVVMRTQTSALLVPQVTTKNAADAVLAYRTDTLAERDRLHVIDIVSPLAKAIQPFTIAKNSDHKHLSRRLFDAIRSSPATFEDAGFHWRLKRDDKAASP